MKLYKITWKDIRYGESQVEAESLKKARVLIDEGKDHDFEAFEPCGDWIVDIVEEIKE